MLLHVRNPEPKYPILAAGNMYVGSKDGFANFYDSYYKTFWLLVQKRISVGSDQHVMCYTCYYFKDACHLYFSGSHKKWFELIKGLKNKDQFFADNYNSSWLGKMKSIFAPEPVNVQSLTTPTGAVSEYPV